MIADCAEFRIRRCVLGAGDRIHIRGREQPRVLSVVSGGLRACGDQPSDFTIRCGDNVLLPYAATFTFAAEGATILLLTEEFAHS